MRILRFLLAVSATLALAVTLWTWLVFECIPMEVSGNGVPWYTECDPPTTVGRFLINLVLVAVVSGPTLVAAIVYWAARSRSGRSHAAALP